MGREGVTGADREGSSPGVTARLAAATALDRVIRQRLDLDRAFAPPASLSASDRAFAYSILVTTLRRRGGIVTVLDALMERPLPSRAGLTRSLMETAAAQLLYMDVAPHAAIHSSVAACKEDRNARHFAGLVNAVLRRVSTEGPQRAALLPSGVNAPAWLFERWRRTYGDAAARAIAEAHLAEPPLDLTAREPGETAAKVGGDRLWNGTIRLKAHKGPVEELPGYADGRWWVQDQAASLPVSLLANTPGDVLDVCAAPGGKTAQLAAAGYRVTAIDRSAARLKTLKENLARLKLEASVVCADFLAWDGEAVDMVVLDAPCTATGTMRRHPDIAWLRTEEDIGKLSALQARLLDHAARFVRPGGRLLYCTCSLEPEECEDQIKGYLERHPSFARAPVTAAEVKGHGELLSAAGDLRTLPNHGMDGFYAARLVHQR
jgi:16S rRNA (cytosine967-C5)-methyltransferase